MKLEEIEANICRDLNVGWRRAKILRERLFQHWFGYKEALQDVTVRYDDDGRIEFTLTINDKQKTLTIIEEREKAKKKQTIEKRENDFKLLSQDQVQIGLIKKIDTPKYLEKRDKGAKHRRWVHDGYKIYMFNKNGGLESVFENMMDAIENSYVNATYNGIIACITGKIKTHAGKIWVREGVETQYLHEEVLKDNISALSKEIPTEENVESYEITDSDEIIVQYDRSGNVIAKYHSLQSALESLRQKASLTGKILNPRRLTMCLLGKRRYYLGYQWKSTKGKGEGLLKKI